MATAQLTRYTKERSDGQELLLIPIPLSKEHDDELEVPQPNFKFINTGDVIASYHSYYISIQK